MCPNCARGFIALAFSVPPQPPPVRPSLATSPQHGLTGNAAKRRPAGRWPWVLLLLSCIGLSIAALYWYRSAAINRVNFDKIQLGMSLAEIESLLGKATPDIPEGVMADIRSSQSAALEISRLTAPPGSMVRIESTSYHWKSRSREIHVLVVEGKVLQKLQRGLGPGDSYDEFFGKGELTTPNPHAAK